MGGGRIVIIRIEESISDATICNFQYRGFEMALSKVICDVVGEVKIIFPLVNSNLMYFDGISVLNNRTILMKCWSIGIYLKRYAGAWRKQMPWSFR